MKAKTILLIPVALFLFTASFTGKRDESKEKAASVKIGKQVWTTANSKEAKFRNGDLIPQAKTKAEWAKAAKDGKAAWCYYNYDPKYENVYGKFYNWHAVTDSRNIAPKGWHMPSDADWQQLRKHLGEKHQGKKMKSEDAWYANGNGSNSSGFNGYGAGYISTDGSCEDLKVSGYWWSTSQPDNYMRDLNGIGYKLHYLFDEFHREDDGYRKGLGFSVRFIED